MQFWYFLLADAAAVFIILVPVFKHNATLIRWRERTDGKINQHKEKIEKITTQIERNENEGKVTRKELYDRLGRIERNQAVICHALNVKETQ